MVWEISGGDLPPIRIHADSFDEAIRLARIRDRRYCGGYVVEDERSE